MFSWMAAKRQSDMKRPDDSGAVHAEARERAPFGYGEPYRTGAARPPLRSERSVGATVVFWEALDPIERDAFRLVASSRTFAAGTRLIEEGSQADHVIVILSGRTKICIDENGRERILAERGPGQLVGERAALQISVRSASVVALETVRALVMRTADFAAFISAHPAVLDIVRSQFQYRRTEDPARYGDDAFAGFPAGEATAGDWPPSAERPAQHPQPLNGENCTVILSDVVGFGSHARTDEDRRVIREALFSMTHTALQELPDVWSWDDRGDGLLTIVPPSVPTAKVIGHLHKELPAALDEHNRAHRDSARIQLRVAINVGPVITDTMGVSGEAIIVTARLVEAPLFKDAMKNGRASLGVIASTFIYEAVIRHDLGLTGYSQVQVNVKESSFAAWMKLFGPMPSREVRERRRSQLIAARSGAEQVRPPSGYDRRAELTWLTGRMSTHRSSPRAASQPGPRPARTGPQRRAPPPGPGSWLAHVEDDLAPRARTGSQHLVGLLVRLEGEPVGDQRGQPDLPGGQQRGDLGPGRGGVGEARADPQVVVNHIVDRQGRSARPASTAGPGAR